MTCFTNLDYKYVHIPFIAPIHCFSPRMSLGHEESCPILFKNLSVQGEVSFASSHQENQGPKSPLLPLFLAVTRCHYWSLLSQTMLLPWRVGCPSCTRCRITALLSLLSHTQPSLPRARPLGRGGWVGRVISISRLPHRPQPSCFEMRIAHQPKSPFTQGDLIGGLLCSSPPLLLGSP